MNKVSKLDQIAVIALATVISALLVLLIALPFMWLWNWLMPVLFGLPSIGFFQSFGILLLSRMIFGWTNNSAAK